MHFLVSIALMSIVCMHVLRAQSCDDEHVQTKYCRADFVVRATLRALPNSNLSQTAPGWRALKLVIKTQIRTTPQFLALTDQTWGEIYVTDSLLANVTIGQNYVISGQLLKLNNLTRLTANSCSWVQLWSTVGHRQKAALRKSKFDIGCDCQIDMSVSTYHPPARSPAASKHMCEVDQSKLSLTGPLANQREALGRLQDCYKHHTHCAKRSAGKFANHCKWNMNRELDQCLMALAQS